MKRKLLTTICFVLLSIGIGQVMADVNANDYKLRGAFSVSATKVIYFSQGNLQYKANTRTWRFAAHQYDYVGDATHGNVYENGTKCDNSKISSSYSGWIDLFGWATSGNKASGTVYQPYSTSTDDASYGPSITDKEWTAANSDWGVVNAAQLGTGWRTPTNAEWNYLVNTRTNAVAKRGLATITVGGVNYEGLILLPDTWNSPTTAITTKWTACAVANNSLQYSNATFTEAEWTAMENAGAVFLPKAGYRSGTSVKGYEDTYASAYWSSTAGSNSNHKFAKSLCFRNKWFNSSYGGNRSIGHSVRLVSETAPPMPATITTNPKAKSLTYNGSEQQLVSAGVASGGTMYYKSGSGAWSSSIPTAKTPGTYTVYYKVVGDENHLDYTPSSNSIKVTVSKKKLYIAAEYKTITYGDDPPEYTVTYSGFQGSDDASSLSGTLTITCPYIAGNNVGSYTITPSGFSSNNYTISYTNATLRVNKADIVISAAPAPVDGLEYDGTTKTLITAGIVEGGTLQYKLNSGAYSTNLPTATEIGEYTVYYKVIGDANHNNFVQTSFKVTITEPIVRVLTAHQDPHHPNDYYCTFYSSNIKYSIPAGTEAYVATISGTDLNMTRIAEAGDILPANTAVIFKATGSSITLTPSDATPLTVYATNDLLGVDVATTAMPNCYVFSGHSADNSVIGVGFYQFSGTLTAHKAYVIYNGASLAPKRMRFIFDDATGIEEVQSEDIQNTKIIENGVLYIISNGIRYNTQGQIVNR